MEERENGHLTHILGIQLKEIVAKKKKCMRNMLQTAVNLNVYLLYLYDLDDNKHHVISAKFTWSLVSLM